VIQKTEIEHECSDNKHPEGSDGAKCESLIDGETMAIERRERMAEDLPRGARAGRKLVTIRSEDIEQNHRK
jgi:hypothetical protein